MGVQQAEGDTRINIKHHKYFRHHKYFASSEHRTETSPRSNNTAPQRSSPTTSRTEASPQDPPSSGSTRTASAQDPESVRETKVEGPRSEANGSRSEAETIGGTSHFRAELSAVTMDYIYTPEYVFIYRYYVH